MIKEAAQGAAEADRPKAKRLRRGHPGRPGRAAGRGKEDETAGGYLGWCIHMHMCMHNMCMYEAVVGGEGGMLFVYV